MTALRTTSIIALLVVGTAACSDATGHASTSELHDPKNYDAEMHDAATQAHEAGVATHDTTQAAGARRAVGAHSHGDAKLAIALEGNVVHIELDTPLYNLLGFEHAAGTADELEAVASVRALLAQPQTLFALSPKARCAATAQGGAPGALAPDANEADDVGHRDALVEFRFSCQAPVQLKDIEVRLFEHFPKITELDVVYLDQDRQASYELSPAAPIITLDR